MNIDIVISILGNINFNVNVIDEIICLSGILFFLIFDLILLLFEAEYLSVRIIVVLIMMLQSTI